MGEMLKKYLTIIGLPLIAIVCGFFFAYLAATVHSIFFVLLPLLVFILGYFSSWTGFLCGLFIFLEYTFTTVLLYRGTGVGWPDMYGGSDYFMEAFIHGGYILLLIGGLAPLLRMIIRKRGIRNVASATALLTLVFLITWCGSITWSKTRTGYMYYYQIIVQSSENLDNIEIYMPAGAVSEEIYGGLYDNAYSDQFSWSYLTHEYILELVYTEYGQMMKVSIPELMHEGSPGYPYTGNIIFMKEDPPHNIIHLTPRYDVVPINKVEWRQEFFGSLKVIRTKLKETFKVPIMVKSKNDAQFSLRLENSTYQSQTINFVRCQKSYKHTELITYKSVTGDELVLTPVEVKATWDIYINGMYD